MMVRRLRSVVVGSVSSTFILLGGWAHAQSTELGRSGDVPGDIRSVVVVTFEDLDRRTEDWLADASAAWPRLEGEETARWWFGRAIPSSNIPVRTLYGLLTGTPPLEVDQLSRVKREALTALSLPLTLWGSVEDGSGASNADSVAAWVGGFRGQRQQVARLVPEPLRYNQLRPVMASLRQLDPPLFFWLAAETSIRSKRSGPIETIERVLTVLRRRGILEQTLVVVSSVHPSGQLGPSGVAGTVPLAVRLPANAEPVRPLWELPQPQQLLTLEAVGAAMREWMGRAMSPAMAPTGPQRWRVPFGISELRDQSGLIGISGREARGQLRVRWSPGKVSACVERSSPHCEWAFEPATPTATEPKPRASEALESAVLLALERQIARDQLTGIN